MGIIIATMLKEVRVFITVPGPVPIIGGVALSVPDGLAATERSLWEVLRHSHITPERNHVTANDVNINPDSDFVVPERIDLMLSGPLPAALLPKLQVVNTPALLGYIASWSAQQPLSPFDPFANISPFNLLADDLSFVSSRDFG